MKKKKGPIIVAAIAVILIIGAIGNTNSDNKKDESQTAETDSVVVETHSEITTEEVLETIAAPENVEQIITKYFENADIEYHSDTKDLYFFADVEESLGASLTFASAGGDLADCITEIMNFDPSINLYDVTLSSPSYPNLIVCRFSPEKLRAISDWENFTQSDLRSVCDAYSDVTE